MCGASVGSVGLCGGSARPLSAGPPWSSVGPLWRMHGHPSALSSAWPLRGLCGASAEPLLGLYGASGGLWAPPPFGRCPTGSGLVRNATKPKRAQNTRASTSGLTLRAIPALRSDMMSQGLAPLVSSTASRVCANQQPSAGVRPRFEDSAGAAQFLSQTTLHSERLAERVVRASFRPHPEAERRCSEDVPRVSRVLACVAGREGQNGKLGVLSRS